MGFLGSFFGKPESPAEPVLPLPRAVRTWPKAQPAARAVPAAPVSSLSAPPAPPVRPAASTPARPPAAPAPAAPAVHEDTSIARMAPAHRKEASQVAQAFAKWKQAQAAAPPPPPPTAAEPSDIVLRPSPEPPPARREDPVMHVARGAALAARGDHEAAIAAFSRAIEIDPKCTTAWAARACSLEAKGDLEAARKDYAKSIDIELRQEISRLRSS